MHATLHRLAIYALLAVLGLGSAQAQSTNDFATVPCIPLGADTSHQTPVDLYRLVAACATAARYDVAIDAFATAGTYGKFDMARVSDESSYGILGAIKNLALNAIPPPNKELFQRAAGQAFDDATQHEAICKRLRSAGPPSYSPDYMLKHGLEAVIQAAGASSPPATAPLRINFAPAEAWKEALAGYFSCK
jgi:hypothetical protein